LNLLMLVHLTGDPELHQKIEMTLKMFGPRLGQLARAVPMMMAALSTYHAKLSQIVIVGPREQAEELLREVAGKYLPFAVVVPVEPGERQAEVARALPFIASMQMRDGRPTAYVCRDFTCGEPVTDPTSLRERLSST
jgi:uncharacterized protein YyaL (SSP411 family)